MTAGCVKSGDNDTDKPGMGNDFDASAREDRAWVLKSKKGNTKAFDRLVLKYQRPLYFLVLKMLGRPADAEDVVQDAFIRAYRSLEQYDLERPFQPWLYRIAINMALTQLDKRKRRSSVALEEVYDVAADNPDPLESSAEQIGTVAVEAAQSLPEDQRGVLLLRIQEHLSYDQIAEVLDIPRGSVMSRLHRARKKLRELLKDYL